MSLQFLLKSQESEKIEINYLKVFCFFFLEVSISKLFSHKSVNEIIIVIITPCTFL